MPPTRATVTLDPDLAARLRELARERDVSFKKVLNATIRAGLATEAPASRRFVVKARSRGPRRGIDFDRVLRLADQLEDEAVIHKLEWGSEVAGPG